MSTLLEVQHLKKYFDVKSGVLHAVDDVSFSIEKGETLGVVGESGCGKSTLGRVLLHLLDNTGGRILYKGEDVTKVSRQKLSELRKEMQLIFQDPYASLNPRMTIDRVLRILRCRLPDHHRHEWRGKAAGKRRHVILPTGLSEACPCSGGFCQ